MFSYWKPWRRRFISVFYYLLGIALVLIVCVVLSALQKLDGDRTEDMPGTDGTLRYFRELGLLTGSDAAQLQWWHGVNSRRALAQALSGPCHMIEADVNLRGHGLEEPIMAHPPDTDSDITLKDWLDEVKTSNKGIKLDFKSLEAVSPSLVLLEDMLAEPRRPVWINADILSGPGGTARPVDSQAFLSIVTALPVQTVLSLGWTTGWAAGGQNPGYSWDMVRLMEEKCGRLHHPVTFPVRAALLPQSFAQLSWLLQQSERYSLTVWTGRQDEVPLQDLKLYRKQLDGSRMYLDLPDSLKAELSVVSLEAE
ncbi:PREDICTED: protein FAM151B-like [Cyprinodon variegatus]|uniref:Family with sequence similarity 151 member B n=1 Tax=Cyprinodon variegatus TaxID=28743 RepID=A0A3Q2EBI1_CYPVA|nr:PREDICTED: protein FAM151B-like [Cyprinodon variegatus]